MKPAGTPDVTTNQEIIDESVSYKIATKGLTPRGEDRLRDMTGRFIGLLSISQDGILLVASRQIHRLGLTD